MNFLDDIMLYASFIALLSLLLVVVYSWRKGGFNEIFENLFLYFLVWAGFSTLLTQPLEKDTGMSAAMFFIAFGICRLAKKKSI